MKKNYKKASAMIILLFFAMNIFSQLSINLKSITSDLEVSQDTFDFEVKERGYFLTKMSYSITNNGVDTAFITYTHSEDPFINENVWAHIAPGETIDNFIKLDRSFPAGNYSKTLYLETSLNDVSFEVLTTIIDNTPDMTFNEMYYWVGTGNNRAILEIDFNDGLEMESLAFGYKFSGTVTAEQMITDITTKFPQLTTTITGGMLSDIFFDDHSGLAGSPDYWMTFSRTASSLWELNWGLTTIVDNGEWFGCSYTGVDSDYNPLDLPDNPDFAGYPTGINEIKNISIEVFPNPVSDFVCVKAKGSMISNIQISDISGKLINNIILPSGTNLKWIDISNLTKGTYQIKIVSGDITECRSLIKL